MISFLTGTILQKLEDSMVVITSGGVGYAVRMARIEEWKIGDAVSLHTYLKVSDQAMELYGFRTLEERSFFELLLSVNGVGPKTAMNILSVGSIDAIENAIARGDAAYLSAVQGIGKKTAERMVVELKSKVQSPKSKVSGEFVGGVFEEVVDGLMGIGYTAEQAREAVRGLNIDGKTTEMVLREALRRVG